MQHRRIDGLAAEIHEGDPENVGLKLPQLRLGHEAKLKNLLVKGFSSLRGLGCRMQKRRGRDPVAVRKK